MALVLIGAGLLLGAASLAFTRKRKRRSLVLGLLIALPLILTAPAPMVASADSCAIVPTAGAFANKVFQKSGGEPNISISPSGKYMFADGLGGAPLGQPANIFRSTDYGATFNKIMPTFPKVGGGDFDIHFLDEHTVIAADLATLSLPSNGVFIDRSEDDGNTWTQINVNQEIYDRPWLDHFGANTVYLATKGFDGIGYLYTSSDGGKSFSPIPLVMYGNPANGGPNPAEIPLSANNAYVDHITVDQHTGDVYVLYGIEAPQTFGAQAPVGVANQLYVAHLVSGQMISHPVYIGAAADSFVAGFNWMTVDQAGTVYVLANGAVGGRFTTRLSYSKDHGTTWSPFVDLGAPGAGNVYGSIAGASPGNLAMIYLRGSNSDPKTHQNWYAEMAAVTSADTGSPVVGRTRPIAQAMHTQDICFDGILCGLPGFGVDRNLLDYIYNAVGPDGRAWGVFSSDGPATGSAPNARPDVVILRQTSGPNLGPGVQS